MTRGYAVSFGRQKDTSSHPIELSFNTESRLTAESLMNFQLPLLNLTTVMEMLF
jgi:hypothetical protein